MEHHETCDHPETELTSVTKFLCSKISEMLICCTFKTHGCDFVCKVKQIEEHEQNCPFIVGDHENQDSLDEIDIREKLMKEIFPEPEYSPTLPDYTREFRH
jgi:hypothetical protein